MFLPVKLSQHLCRGHHGKWNYYSLNQDQFPQSLYGNMCGLPEGRSEECCSQNRFQLLGMSSLSVSSNGRAQASQGHQFDKKHPVVEAAVFFSVETK